MPLLFSGQLLDLFNFFFFALNMFKDVFILLYDFCHVLLKILVCIPYHIRFQSGFMLFFISIRIGFPVLKVAVLDTTRKPFWPLPDFG